MQQNCNQRSSRETSNYDRFQPNQQRRQTNGSYPSRSGYNLSQRRSELPSQFNANNPRMAVLDDGDYEDSFVAPLERNTNHQTISEERSEYSGINWSDVGAQIGKELSQQLPNMPHLVPEVIQQGQVEKNQSPTVVIKVPNPESENGQQTMEPNNENQATCEDITADRPERQLPGHLEAQTGNTSAPGH